MGIGLPDLTGGGLPGLPGSSGGTPTLGGSSSMPNGDIFGLKLNPMHMTAQAGGKCIVKACGSKTGQTALPIAGQMIGSIWGPMGAQIGSMAGQQAANDAASETQLLAQKEAARKQNSIFTV